MRSSCNGCRILRKGCGENCTIRPCLEWIKVADAQSNATLFLAKFYGRAGLLNLINAGTPDKRPAIFKSLLYEACGRIVNPVYGSLGLLWSGNWAQCQAAVNAVLEGTELTGSLELAEHQLASQTSLNPSLGACDIRHVFKENTMEPVDIATSDVRAVKGKTRFKRNGTGGPTLIRPVAKFGSIAVSSTGCKVNAPAWVLDPVRSGVKDGSEDESVFSVETVEGCLLNRDRANWAMNDVQDPSEMNLDLTLG